MPKTHTYTVTHEGQTFTRNTARTYSWVVLTKQDEAAYTREAQQVTKTDRANWKWISKAIADLAEGKPLSQWERQAAERCKDMDEDAYIADTVAMRMAGVRAQKAQGLFDTWSAVRWSARKNSADTFARGELTRPWHPASHAIVLPVPAI